jgi:hypothetical protein
MDDGRLRLNSYRLAFALERRIHRIDTFRIPLPYGLPLASLGWGVVAMVAMLAFSAVPGVGPVLRALPFPVRLVFLPGLFAHLVSRTTGDGRPFHEALIARAQRCVRPTTQLGLDPLERVRAWELEALPMVSDELAPEYRAAEVRGPATVLLRQPGQLVARGRRVQLTASGDRPLLRARELRILPGQRLVIR